MICSGANLRLNKRGQIIPIEKLMIGDGLYSPIIDEIIEVEDILSKSAQDEQGKLNISLVTIGVKATDNARQTAPITVSRHQNILTLTRRTYGRPIAQIIPASSANDATCVQLLQCIPPHAIFAIFTSSGQFIEANGILLSTYKPESIASSAQQRVKGRVLPAQRNHY